MTNLPKLPYLIFTALIVGLFSFFSSVKNVQAQSLDGVWTLVKIHGTSLAARKNVTLTVRGRQYSFNAGCNGMGGGIRMSRRRITFLRGISTKIGCPDNYEDRISALLFKTHRFRLRGQNLVLVSGKTRLVFSSRADLTRGSESALGRKTWSVNSIRINSAMVSSIHMPEQFIRFNGGRAIGQAGCGTFIASYRLDGDNLRFFNIKAPSAFCADSRHKKFHNAFIANLSKIRKIDHMGGNRYWLRDGRGGGRLAIR